LGLVLPYQYYPWFWDDGHAYSIVLPTLNHYSGSLPVQGKEKKGILRDQKSKKVGKQGISKKLAKSCETREVTKAADILVDI